MPIRPENKKRYPPNWREISERIRRRSRGRCECRGECGQKHATRSGRCQARNGEPHPQTGSKVVLTVAHKDHTPENCGDENLGAWCQRCHNLYDAPVRAAGIKARRRKEMAIADLFEGAG